MNIQIFGTKKCNDTRKVERFFKERGIKYQFIDMKEKGMSKGEFISVAQAHGGLENMINWDGKDQDMLALIKYIADEGENRPGDGWSDPTEAERRKLEKVLENPQVISVCRLKENQLKTIDFTVFSAQRWYNKVHGFNRS